MMRHHGPRTEAPSSRVVVLGASGFVGKDLVRHLEGLGVATLGLASREVDLSQPASVAAIRQILSADDAVVFVSAITPDRGRDAATLMRNLVMAAHVSTAMQETALAHLVYISSDAVYADDAHPVRETSCCAPSTFHGLMHLSRERMLLEASRARGVPLAIVRPCAIYGAGDTHGSYGPNNFVKTSLEEARLRLIGNGEEKRDHLYVRDLSQVVASCLAYRSEGIVNVASGRATSFFDVARTVSELRGGNIAIERVPRSRPVTHRHFDISELLRAYPAFSPTPLRAGLARTLEAIGGVAHGRS